MISITTQNLPYTSLIWNGEAEILAAGYDCEPFRFRGGEDGWELVGSVEAKRGPAAAVEDSARNMFRQMDLRGKAKDDTQLTTTHQNTISTLRVFSASAAGVQQFTTSGVDGRVVIWNA